MGMSNDNEFSGLKTETLLQQYQKLEDEMQNKLSKEDFKNLRKLCEMEREMVIREYNPRDDDFDNLAMDIDLDDEDGQR